MSSTRRQIRPMKWIRYGIEFLFLMILNIVAILIPWALAWRLGRGLGWLSYRFFPIRGKVLYRNLRRAYPDMDDVERERIALACFQHWGESFVSTLKLWILPKWKIRRLVTAPDLDPLIDEARAAGEPVLYFTGHYGSWEMAGRYVCDYAKEGSSIYRVQKNPLSEWYLSGVREMRGMRLIHSRSGISSFVEALQRVGCIAVVGDQYKSRNAVTVDFFGIPSQTPKGAAIMTHRATCWVVFLVSRQERGKFYIHVEKVAYEPPEELNENWVYRFTQDLTSRLEREIRAHPEQYFWFHQRWRDHDRLDRQNAAGS